MRTALGSFVTAATLIAASLSAQAPRTDAMLTSLDVRAAHYAGVAQQIWSFAELGYMETKSSALLQSELTQAGFRMKAGVAGIPTAFTAEYGSGKPVIAIIGEFDALPGLSQDSTPAQHALVSGGAGHGCGHNLFGSASVASAIAVKEWMIANKITGTLRFYGTPAEEGGGGKVYMLRDGFMSDVDVAVSWHPGDHNSIASSSTTANISGKFKFHGVSAHAAAAPSQGRSALDAVEVMDVMTNFMREHIPQEARIHYVITNGGKAPNVVPDFAEVYYTVRHNDMRVVNEIWDRVVNAAKGAALGTGTTFDVEIVNSVYNQLINQTLSKVGQRALERVGGYTYTAAEQAWAEKLQKTLPVSVVPLASTAAIRPLDFASLPSFSSTDMGDVSWSIPTVEVMGATYVPGTPAHSWQAAAAAGMSIGSEGMMVAAKTMALTAAELFTSPATITEAKAELKRLQGPDFKYASRVGTQKPPLDYRK